MIRVLWGFFGTGYPKTIVYMLQSTEYHPWPYLKWYWRTNNFSMVAKRRTLDKTSIAKLLLAFMHVGIGLQVLVGAALLWQGISDDNISTTAFGLAILISYPIVWAHLVVLPTMLGQITIIQRRNKQLAAAAQRIFADHPGTVIAIAGSYGKTSMKELLLTVMGEGKKVAATPANKNVITEHAKFARTLSGDEDIIIVEYGEEKPGYIMQFARVTQPDVGVITGVTPAHLDNYKTVEKAGQDIFMLAGYLKDKNVYVNGESPDARPFIKPEHIVYDENGALGWQVKHVLVSIEGVGFTMTKGKQTLQIKSNLIGRHQISSLALAAALAAKLGLSKHQIESAIAKTVPFEHRMQPYNLHGAWVIDDTYNGNIEGMKAGLRLLKELSFKRKIYVTPGLVDQGEETKRVHIELGKAIAQAAPNRIVLMENSVTKYIQSGLKQADYKGEVIIEDDPLTFYTNLDQFLAAGDLVLMQNDWTDNYN